MVVDTINNLIKEIIYEQKFISVSSALLLLLTSFTTSFANGQTEYYSNEVIQEKANETLELIQSSENVPLKSNLSSTNSEISPLSGSFYSEWPVEYQPNTTIQKFDAFEVGIYSFDTTGERYPSSLTISYNQSQEVAWTISGGGEVNVKYALIEGKIDFSISRQSSTATAYGASITKTVDPNKYGYVKIYAHGVATTGVFKYKWQDVAGNTGYNYKTESALIPFKEYQKSNIHFGPLTYR